MADVEKRTAEETVDAPQVKKQKLEEEEEVKVAPENGSGTDAATSEVSKLERDIIDQIEYYFSDSNLFRDKFLQGEIAKNEGWVALSTLLTFKRLSALTTNAAVIVDALDKSDEGLVEVSEDRQSVRRHPERPLPEMNEELRKEIISRTAYVKGFPQELDMQALLEFFKSYPKVVNVVIRKYLDKPSKTHKSKGSVFATFTTRDQCAAFLSAENVKFNDAALICKWQTDYYAGKKAEKQEKQKERNAKNEPVIELPKGASLQLTGIGADVTREVIKAALEALEVEVGFVDFSKGDEKAFVRLKEENTAAKVLEKLTDGKLKLEDVEATIRLLEGEEEEKYLADSAEQIKQRRKTQKHGRKGNKRRHND